MHNSEMEIRPCDDGAKQWPASCAWHMYLESGKSAKYRSEGVLCLGGALASI